jgi:hypothetical protein
LRNPIPLKIVDSFEQNPNWPREMLWLVYIQELKPSLQLVAAIDRERKSECANPHSKRSRRLCDALNYGIDEFTQKCTDHFIDGRRR